MDDNVIIIIIGAYEILLCMEGLHFLYLILLYIRQIFKLIRLTNYNNEIDMVH